MKPITVKRRMKFPKGRPVCEGFYLYTIDNGKTWMNAVEFDRFKSGLVRVEEFRS